MYLLHFMADVLCNCDFQLDKFIIKTAALFIWFQFNPLLLLLKLHLKNLTLSVLYSQLKSMLS